MKRKLYQDLLKWKNSPYRKPLVLKGARQTGKSWLIKEFGKTEFAHFYIFNCDKDSSLETIFSKGYDTERIIRDLEIKAGEKIDPKTSLIFFDEIQAVPRALTALKYFCEDAPQYYIIAAGSLLGLAIHEGSSYPVGKTDELTLYPMSFSEFVLAGKGNLLYEKLTEGPVDEIDTMRDTCMELLREYYFTGGMPEAVKAYVIEKRLPADIRNIQKTIIADYALDISKHAPKEILGRIHQVWNSIPQQLVKQNKKFVYGDIQKGARAKDFEIAVQWLIDAGMIAKVPRVRKAGIPLKYYEDFSAFKLFLSDLGLMGAMVDAPVSEILISDNIFTEYKESFTEQYVFQQFQSCIDNGIFYYSAENSQSELDFLLQNERHLIPVEVKAEENLQAKSLRQFSKKYPDSKPVRISMNPYREEDWMINLPLYATEQVKRAVESEENS